MGLKDYLKKRKLSSGEPMEKKLKVSKKLPIFVVQKHDASRLHYDFRLEMEGVLKSWAVPKGPPEEPDIRRLAVHVEDHPYEYAKFHGTIPEGHYGAGTVEIWDKGTYQPLDKNYQPISANDLLEDYHKGKIHFILYGKKLTGLYTLFSFKEEKDWMLVKNREQLIEEL